MFAKESLEQLRTKVDLVEVLEPYVEFKKAGASYKALCPFHDEKTPSFTISRGDTHYHCFGCGAHGDAISFLMDYVKMNFKEAVESLAERFHVPLEEVAQEHSGPSRSRLKMALEQACLFYHNHLLHSQEGREALVYLKSRHIDLAFIKQFQMGLAPKDSSLLKRFLNEQRFSDEELFEAGLIKESQGKKRDFFSSRIMFPIHNAQKQPIAFSGRKYQEETFGGKYVNSKETPLFKKSHCLFGLGFCRSRVIKERLAILVEGQLDALRLINEGINVTLASQGTAFGEGHVAELKRLGVQLLYLAFDGDLAGQVAAKKVGNLCQAAGIEVRVALMPEGQDPDSWVLKHGPENFLTFLETSMDYLAFCVKGLGDLKAMSPAAKSEAVRELVLQIRSWDEHPVLVHESLKRLAQLTQIPESALTLSNNVPLKQYVLSQGKLEHTRSNIAIDPDRILEGDLLRLLIFGRKDQERYLKLCMSHLKEEDFKSEVAREIYTLLLRRFEKKEPCDLISLNLESSEAASLFLQELGERKVNWDRAESYFEKSLRQMLERNWLEKTEAVRLEIQSGELSESEAIAKAKVYAELKQNKPELILSSS